MKKILLSILVAASCAFAASAQTKAGDSILSFNVGAFGLEDVTFGIGYEYIVADNLFGAQGINFGLGLNVGYYGYSDEGAVAGVKYKYEHDNFLSSLRAAIHFVPIESLDFYIAGNAGVGTLVETATVVAGNAGMKAESETDPVFVYAGVAGVRYHIKGGLGVGLEGAYGTAQSAVSVSFLFSF